MGDLLTPLSLHAHDLVRAEQASVGDSVVTLLNICPLTAPFLFLDLLQTGFQLSPAPSQRDSTALQAADGNTLVVTVLGGQIHCLFVKRCCSQF